MKIAISKSTVTLKSPSEFRFDKTKDGWRLVENTKIVGGSTLCLAPFLKKDKSCISWYIGLPSRLVVKVKRAKVLGDKGNTGQLHAERLFEQQESIPEDWREFVLVFTKTVWRGLYDCPYVPFLIWGGDEWFLSFSDIISYVNFD